MADASYIGSTIHLVSQADIRYEGILDSIDPLESTLTLKDGAWSSAEERRGEEAERGRGEGGGGFSIAATRDREGAGEDRLTVDFCIARTVRSFGTEGRRTNGVQIPASVEVYDYITFRGDDIKDLALHEPRTQQQQQYMQPQYMQPQQYGYGGYMGAPQQGYMGYPPQQQSYGMPPQQYGMAPQAWGQPPPQQQQIPMQPPAQPQQPPAQQPPTQQPRAQQPPVPKQPAPAPAPKKSAWGNPNPPAAEGVILPAARNAAPPPGGVAKTAETVQTPKPPAPKPKPTSFAAAALNAMAPDEVARMKAAPKVAVRTQTSSGRGVPAPRTGGRGGRGGRGAAPVIPKEEFNFEKMLQRFNKEKLAQSAEAKKLSTEVQANPVYVKDDFFDTMSSEATEKASGKPRFHEQRRMDAMTFGFDAVSASHAAQRVAAAGRGGRGGATGGRGGGGRGGRSVVRGGRN